MRFTWYVRINGRVVGWVIADNEDDARAAAYVKFPGWGIEENLEVEQLQRKRKRRVDV